MLATAAVAACSGGGSKPSGTTEGGAEGEGGADDGAAGTSPDAGGASSCGCASHQTCCDSECVDLDTDALHCGECGNACAPKQAVAACIEGACAIESCEEGFVDCNSQPADGCEVEDAGLPTRPRLLAPAIGAHTGSAFADASLMPTLRWMAAAEGSCGELSYQVQFDDSCIPGDSACAFDSPELDESGITELVWRPTTPLPVSTDVPVGTQYFWRVRACEPGDRCSDWSEARYLNVGRLRDDFNADGFSDVFAMLLTGALTPAPGNG
jgi:hypothetical protein